jgi:hypothetical protein
LASVASGQDIYNGSTKVDTEYSACVVLPRDAQSFNQSIINIVFQEKTSGKLYLDGAYVNKFDEQLNAFYSGHPSKGKHVFKIVVERPTVVTRIEGFGNLPCDK